MTLATHVVTGAAVAGALTKDPVAAFLAGWISHYLLDAIPHWDYKIVSFEAKDKTKPLDKKVEFGKAFVQDVFKVVADAMIGFLVLAITLWASGGQVGLPETLVLLVGAFGGAFPDFLQFVYGITKVWPVRKLQEFHQFIHAEFRLDDNPRVGVPLQIAFVALAGTILLSFVLGN